MTYTIMDPVEVLPVGSANASVIWMHGLGANGEDFLDILDQFKFNPGIKIRFIFPNAPVRAITCNHGLKMQAWYDIKEFEEIAGNNQQQDSHAGLIESQQLIKKFIQQEIDQGIPSDRIVLIGFSQGGALALHTGLRFSNKLAGIACLSGYLPWEQVLGNERHTANQETAIFMSHGIFDPIIPLSLAEQSYKAIKYYNYDIEWHAYSMPHTIIDNEIIDLNNFLNKVLDN